MSHIKRDVAEPHLTHEKKSISNTTTAHFIK